jgi:hypothetical protein
MRRMTEEEILDCLCYYDTRSPDYVDDTYGDPDETPTPPRQRGCSCDNCFHGLDRLAVELLETRAENEPYEVPHTNWRGEPC